MKYWLSKIALVVLLNTLFFSCVKKPIYPSEPVIAYENFLRYGDPSDPDSVEIVIFFTDNEGDIGLDPQSAPKGNICVYESYWDTTGVGHWAVYDPPLTPQVDTSFNYYFVPLVLSDGDPEEPMKGMIFIKLRPFVKIFDRIKYTIYMTDLAQHKSNTIETASITFP